MHGSSWFVNKVSLKIMFCFTRSISQMLQPFYEGVCFFQGMKATVENEDDSKKELLSVLSTLAANHGAPAKKGIEDLKSSSDTLDKLVFLYHLVSFRSK